MIEKRTFFKFCSETSLHGWRYLNVGEMSLPWKMIWLIFLLVVSFVSVYVIVVNTQQHLVSISSMISAKLLRTQILKVQKKTDSLTVFYALLGSECVKAVCRTLMKLTTESNNNYDNFVNHGLAE